MLVFISNVGNKKLAVDVYIALRCERASGVDGYIALRGETRRQSPLKRHVL